MHFHKQVVDLQVVYLQKHEVAVGLLSCNSFIAKHLGVSGLGCVAFYSGEFKANPSSRGTNVGLSQAGC